MSRHIGTHIRALLRDIVLEQSLLVRAGDAEESFFEVRLVFVVAGKVDDVDEMTVVDDCGSVAKFLDKVEVEYYGTMTPLNQMANVTIAEARVLVVSVWDKSALKNVEKAILAANVGITPNNDGTVIRLVFPEVTEERRRALVKDIKQGAEETKIVLRNHRRDINEELKKLKKDSAITEDDLTNFLEEVDKRLAKEIEKVDETAKKKEDEVMSV